MKETQRGGTFLGLIAGMVIGLAVALSVAIYVAKVPVPFVNKGNTRTNGQDAAEAEKNRDWDPNNLLRGKSTPVAAPAASGTPIAPPAEVERGQAADSPRSPAATAAAAPATQPARNPSASSDPLGDIASLRLRRDAAPEPAAPAADSALYFVQVGAFRSPEEAEGQRARLLLTGVQAQISEREQAGRPMYRVRVGPFQNRDAAERVKTRLAGDGFDAALAGVPR